MMDRADRPRVRPGAGEAIPGFFGTAERSGVAAMRIIAGQRRGHKIDGPRAATGTRPTSDLVRESMFNILRELVVDRVVVDLFAGTGALGSRR